jgi:hypothetical protein
MDDLTRVLLGSIMRLLHQDMARDHQLVRAYPRHRRRNNRRVQRALRVAAAAQGTPATARALEQPLTTEPSYMPMEPSPPHPAHFIPTARSDDLSQFYGQIEGVNPLSAIGGVGTSHVMTSAPPEGGAIIDLNISAIAAPSPSPTLATTDMIPNGLRIHSTTKP